jgi:hypothetical protein
MTPLPEVSAEFVRRVIANQTPTQLREWVTQALADEAGVQPESGWQIRTAADALQPHPPMEYLVDQLLPAPCLAIVYGGPGSLKSMILADLAVCVAGGIRWLDALDSDQAQNGATFSTVQAPVLWIDFDNGARRTDIRIGAMLRAHQLDAETPMHYVSMPTPHLDASNDAQINALADLVTLKGYRLIIVDNLGLVTGNTEENSAEMANVMGRLRRLSEQTGAAVILIHHQRKSSGGMEANGVRKGETLRGHSSIEASLDLALLVERKEGEDSIAIIPTKVRDFLAHSIIGAHFTYEHAPESRDLWQARFFSTATLNKEETAIAELRAVILDICKQQPGIAQKPLVDEVRDTIAASGNSAPGVNKVRGTIKNMVDDGRLRVTGKAGSHAYWPS